MFNILNKLIGSSNEKRLKSFTKIIQEINNFETIIKSLSDTDLAKKTLEIKEK